MKLICLLIALTLNVAAAESGPGEAALRFLKSVRSMDVDLKPGQDTAISPHTSPQKVKAIAGRLERMVMDLGQRPLRVGRVKTDGDLAGVLVWLEEGHDPSLMQVFPVAMVLRNDQWLPAPVPASFENCNIGYTRDTRQRTLALENWMLRQQVIDLADLRTRAVTHMRQKISTGITRSALDNLKPADAIERFLTGCREGKEYELLGLMGGLQDTLPENWVLLATSIEAAIHRPETLSNWRLLMADNVLRIRVYEDIGDDQATITLACIDPEAAPLDNNSLPQIQIISIEARRNSFGELRVQPPPFIWNPSTNTNGVADPDLDKDLLDAFSGRLRRKFPAAAANTEHAASKRLAETLKKNAFSELLPLMKLTENDEMTRASVIRAADLWGQIHALETPQRAPASQWLVPLGITTSGDNAAASFQWFSTRKPDRYEMEVFYFSKSAKGWLWNAMPDQTTTDEFEAWRRAQRDEWRGLWREHLLASCPVLEEIPASDAPSEAECRRLMTSWLEALSTGNIDAAIQHCARLNASDSSIKLLRNLGYDIAIAASQDKPLTVRNIYRDRGWAAAGLDTLPDQKPAYPFYPIIATASGPRILLEADLIASTARGRVFLNDTTLNALKKLDAEAASSLAKLFDQHKKACLDENK